jgi:hypothetical protein
MHPFPFRTFQGCTAKVPTLLADVLQELLPVPRNCLHSSSQGPLHLDDNCTASTVHTVDLGMTGMWFPRGCGEEKTCMLSATQSHPTP